MHIIIINAILNGIKYPKCIGGKDCHLICSSKGYFNRPFMCLEGCQCEQDHKQCDTNIKWKNFKELLSKKFMESSAEIKNYLKQVDYIYKPILKEFQRSYNQMKSLQYAYGLNEVQREAFSKIRQGRVSELNGNLLSQIQLKSERPYSQFTIIDDNFLESKKIIKKQSYNISQRISLHNQLVVILSNLEYKFSTTYLNYQYFKTRDYNNICFKFMQCEFS